MRSARREAVNHAQSPAVGLSDVSSCKWSSVSRRGRRRGGGGAAADEGARPHPQQGTSPSQGPKGRGEKGREPRGARPRLHLGGIQEGAEEREGRGVRSRAPTAKGPGATKQTQNNKTTKN